MSETAKRSDSSVDLYGGHAGNVEIQDLIVEKSSWLDVYKIDALPCKQMQGDDSDWLRLLAFHGDERERDRLFELIRKIEEKPSGWGQSKIFTPAIGESSKTIHYAVDWHSIGGSAAGTSRTAEASHVGAVGDWIRNPDEVIKRLSERNTSESERDRAVLFGATMAFDEGLRPSLLKGLAFYIDEFRFTEDAEKVTLVGAAARCYGLNMDEPQFESYAKWLIPDGSQYVNSLVELELVKGVHWRISYEPITQKQAYPQLCDALAEVSLGYTNRRMVLQENFASIASLSAMSVFALEAIAGQSERSASIWKQTAATGVDFYVELVREDSERLVADIDSHDSELSELIGRHIEQTCRRECS